MVTEGKPAVQKALHSLQMMSLDEETRRLYEAREMFLHDQATRMQEAKEEGLEEGLMKGKEQGLEEGMMKGKKQGVEEGKKQERETVAKNLLSLGMDNEFVIKATGLDNSDIEKLKKTILLPSE